jgi:hypothetical protein
LSSPPRPTRRGCKEVLAGGRISRKLEAEEGGASTSILPAAEAGKEKEGSIEIPSKSNSSSLPQPAKRVKAARHACTKRQTTYWRCGGRQRAPNLQPQELEWLPMNPKP